MDGSAATKTYEDIKRTHLDTEAACQEEGISFIPMICDAIRGKVIENYLLRFLILLKSN